MPQPALETLLPSDALTCRALFRVLRAFETAVPDVEVRVPRDFWEVQRGARRVVVSFNYRSTSVGLERPLRLDRPFDTVAVTTRALRGVWADAFDVTVGYLLGALVLTVDDHQTLALTPDFDAICAKLR